MTKANKISLKEESELQHAFDPLAYIVFRLPKPLWENGREQLRHLSEHLRWNIKTGEIQLNERNADFIPNSNIVNILHHSLDSSTPEPEGYDKAFPRMLMSKNPTKPERQRTRQKTLGMRKRGRPLDDKFVWEPLPRRRKR